MQDLRSISHKNKIYLILHAPNKLCFNYYRQSILRLIILVRKLSYSLSFNTIRKATNLEFLILWIIIRMKEHEYFDQSDFHL